LSGGQAAQRIGRPARGARSTTGLQRIGSPSRLLGRIDSLIPFK